MTTQTPQQQSRSNLELMVFFELVRRGLEPNLDFVYQAPYWGGRTRRGGLIFDFVFTNPPNLAINVQGEYWHYERDPAQMEEDRLLRAMALSINIVLVFIDESDIENRLRWIVDEALNYRDHSRLA